MALALTDTPPPFIVNRCPSCHQVGRLTNAGQQHIPLQVAKNLNLPTVIQLWQCPHCHSTISQPSLEKTD